MLMKKITEGREHISDTPLPPTKKKTRLFLKATSRSHFSVGHFLGASVSKNNLLKASRRNFFPIYLSIHRKSHFFSKATLPFSEGIPHTRFLFHYFIKTESDSQRRCARYALTYTHHPHQTSNSHVVLIDDDFPYLEYH